MGLINTYTHNLPRILNIPIFLSSRLPSTLIRRLSERPTFGMCLRYLSWLSIHESCPVLPCPSPIPPTTRPGPIPSAAPSFGYPALFYRNNSFTVFASSSIGQPKCSYGQTSEANVCPPDQDDPLLTPPHLSAFLITCRIPAIFTAD